MPAEKQNNISDKIDAMRELPEGFDFRPERVWKRLEPQLKKTTVNYRAVFFAAASFFAVIIFVSLPAKRKEQAASVDIKPLPALPESIKPEIASANNFIVKKVKAIREIKKPVEKINLISTQESQRVIVITPPVNKENEEKVSEIKPEISVAVTVKPKRRFFVAHVNELNTTLQPEGEEPARKSITTFTFRKHSVEIVPSMAGSFEEGFTDRKKPKSIFPLLNSSQ